jgi:hypothetical protein
MGSQDYDEGFPKKWPVRFGTISKNKIIRIKDFLVGLLL